MFDLYLGLTILLLCSIVSGFLAFKLGKRFSKTINYLLLVTSLALMMCYYLFLHNSVVMAWLLPFSNLVVLGNWSLIGVAFIAGFAWRLMPGGMVRRSWPLVALIGLGVYASILPLLGRSPNCHDSRDIDGICRQTSRTTCSAACAATLLSMHDIQASESEMSSLCLSRTAGTTWQGLYRGLKLKTAGSDYRVEVFSGSVDDLRSISGTLILTVGLDAKQGVDPIYIDQYGWTVGQYHTVMFYGFVGEDRVAMADPDVGREQWSLNDLSTLYRNRGMRLVERAP